MMKCEVIGYSGQGDMVLCRSDYDRPGRGAANGSAREAGSESGHPFRHAERVGDVGYWRVIFPAMEVEWSAGFRKICGLAEVARPSLKSALAIYHPDDALLARKSLAKARDDGMNWEHKCRVRRPDGEVRDIKSHGVCELNDAGETIGIVGVISDITELEAARREAKAAKAASSSFLAHMSHEIRTPMTGVIGFVELLQEGELDSQQRRRLDLVHDSATALLSLLNDMLDLSKIQAGRLEIAATRYDARDGIEQCVRLTTPMAEQKGIQLSLAFERDFRSHLDIDGLRLRQILLNLIGNAIKFTETGSVSVTVATSVGADGAEILHLSVADTGIGIPAERTAAIFDAYVQAEPTTALRFGGSGLGLSISRQLAEMMGGAIHVQSEVGQGTRMILELPLVRASAPAFADPTAPQPSLAVTGHIAPPDQARTHPLDDPAPRTTTSRLRPPATPAISIPRRTRRKHSNSPNASQPILVPLTSL